MTSYRNTYLLIDGTWCDAHDGRTLDVVDPSSGEVIGSVAHASIADLDQALAAAEKGFISWSAMSAFDRSKIMRKAAELLRQRVETIAEFMTREQGKPLAEARIETLAGADIIDWFAEEARRTYGQIIPARAGGIAQLAIKLPVGPVAAFTPWNFPINQTVRKLSAALAAGCSIIIKGPEETPASPAELIRCFVDAGVPAGVVNLVYGNPAQVSKYLIEHPTIQKISFTGSTTIGKQLAALAGAHMKRATMELGGHAPVIILEDADVSRAVDVTIAAKFRNAGQVCVAPTRFLVHDAVYDAFLNRFASATATITVGNGLEPQTRMGPLANERRVSTLEALVADAVARGAGLQAGGRRTGNKGYFFEPTILTDVPRDARIMNEEPFGPVAIINRIHTLDEALDEANRLPFGLASYAFTRSTEAIHRLSMELRAGMTTINHNGLSLPEVPFGGVRDSGYGSEGGAEAIEPYLITRFMSHMAL